MFNGHNGQKVSNNRWHTWCISTRRLASSWTPWIHHVWRNHGGHDWYVKLIHRTMIRLYGARTVKRSSYTANSLRQYTEYYFELSSFITNFLNSRSNYQGNNQLFKVDEDTHICHQITRNYYTVMFCETIICKQEGETRYTSICYISMHTSKITNGTRRY